MPHGPTAARPAFRDTAVLRTDRDALEGDGGSTPAQAVRIRWPGPALFFVGAILRYGREPLEGGTVFDEREV